MPLTGDASDRRYFRVLMRDAPSQVLAVHPRPIDFERLPFANVARLLSAMPVPGAANPRTLGSARHHGAAGSRRRDAAGAPRRGVRRRAQGALSRGGDAHRDAAAARRRAGVTGLRALRDRVRRREADVGAAVLHQALPRGLSRRGAAAAAREALADELAAIVEELAPSRACSAIATITAAT